MHTVHYQVQYFWFFQSLPIMCHSVKPSVSSHNDMDDMLLIVCEHWGHTIQSNASYALINNLQKKAKLQKIMSLYYMTRQKNSATYGKLVLLYFMNLLRRKHDSRPTLSCLEMRKGTMLVLQ